jgi:hypothetical protein
METMWKYKLLDSIGPADPKKVYKWNKVQIEALNYYRNHKPPKLQPVPFTIELTLRRHLNEYQSATCQWIHSFNNSSDYVIFQAEFKDLSQVHWMGRLTDHLIPICPIDKEV